MLPDPLSPPSSHLFAPATLLYECRERSIDGDLVTSRLPSSPAVFGSIRLLVSDLKLNLGVGAYRLNVVKKGEKQAYAGKRRKQRGISLQHQMDISSYYMDVHTIRQELIQLLSKGKRFADGIQEKKNIPFFDIAYQGFASGSLDADAYSISLFVDRGLELLVAQSYSKKLGLVKIQLKRLARPMYSNPPVHGARIVANIVRDPNLFDGNKRWN
ncbi:unnamed protein product [Musa acuminata var. zebrina]